MIICGFFSKPDSIATVGNLCRVLDRLVGVDVAEQDVVVGVHAASVTVWKPMRRAAGADLDLDAGVVAARVDQRTGHRTRLSLSIV